MPLLGQLERPHLAVATERRDAQSRLLPIPCVILVHLEAAEVLAAQVAATASTLDLCVWHDAHRARTVQPRAARRGPRRLACDRRNHDVAPQRCVLSRI